MSSVRPRREESQTQHARVYVNGHSIDIKANDPTVAEVMRKAGYDPVRHDVFQLRDAKDKKGKPLTPETVLHLSGREEPVYLRCRPKKGAREETPSILPTLTVTPDDDPRRGLGMTDLEAGAPPGPTPPPEPPGPPGLL